MWYSSINDLTSGLLSLAQQQLPVRSTQIHTLYKVLNMSNKLVLVLNCGSSSLKFAIIDAATGEDQISGLAECFGLEDSRIKWKVDGKKLMLV